MARDNLMIFTAGKDAAAGTAGNNTPHTQAWTGAATVVHVGNAGVKQSAVGTSVSPTIAVKELLSYQNLNYGPGGKTNPYADYFEFDMILRASCVVAGSAAGTSQTFEFITCDNEDGTGNIEVLFSKPMGTSAVTVGELIRGNAKNGKVRKYVAFRIVTAGTAPGTYATVQAWIDVA